MKTTHEMGFVGYMFANYSYLTGALASSRHDRNPAFQPASSNIPPLPTTLTCSSIVTNAFLMRIKMK